MICASLLAILCVTVSWGQHSDSNGSKECQTSALPRSINDFGAELTRGLGETDNIFLSPLSIYTALAMTFLGARGQTADQMQGAMKISANNSDQSQFHESFNNILSTIKNNNDEYSLLLANGIFMQIGFEVNSDYINDIQTYYSAILKLVDFFNNGDDAKNQINNFVEENTNGKIEDFLPEALDSSTVLALLNAIYFKGIWQIQFPNNETRDGPFQTGSGATKTVQFMMLKNTHFFYLDDSSYKYTFIELPYKGGDISMILALPNSYQQVPTLDMTTELLCYVKANMKNETINIVQIPKFQLKYRKSLVGILQQLGITDLFTNNADLTGIASTGGIKVSDVIHEAVVDVIEEGSEAAAVTGVIVTTTSVNSNNFIADHPFTFYIVDNRNGLVLFSGRVSDPS